jgi:uncharacterized protein (TIGR02246 family)
MKTNSEIVNEPVIVPENGGTVLEAFGDLVKVKLGTDQTHGTLTVALDEIPPGGGPPLHYHDNEDELFILQEGRVSYFVQNHWTDLGPGGVVFAPRGSVHAFRNTGSTPARHYVVLTPAGFEKFFASCAEEFARPGGPGMERILEIGAEHGIHILGAPPEPPARATVSAGAADGNHEDAISIRSASWGKTRGESNDEQALRKLVAALENAWNVGDSVAWAAQFATDADFIHILGGHFYGQNSIEHGHRAIFDTIYKGSTNSYTVQKIQFLAPHIALVFLLAQLKVTQPGLPQLIQARPTLVVQKLGSSWKIVAFQNTLITAEAKAPGNEQLAEGIHSALNSTVAQRHPVLGHAGPPVAK